MYGYGYRYNSGLVIGAGGGAPFANTYSTEYDGIDDYVDIGNGINFEYTDAFSISTWVKPLAESGVKYLFSKYTGGRGILIYLNSSSGAGSNTLNFNLYNTNTGSTATRKRITTSKTSFASPNIWTNIIITYDGSGLASGISFYKNGVSQTVAVAQDNLQNNTIVVAQNAYISGNNFASSFFPGNQDEFSLFNTELSSGDALSIYGTGEATDLTDLNPLGWYRFEEGSGTTATDSGSGGNNGTLENGVVYSTDVP